MNADVVNFLHSLVAALAAVCAPAPLVAGRDFWALEADETTAVAGSPAGSPRAFAALRPYSGGAAPDVYLGSFAGSRPRDLSLQVWVIGRTPADALALAEIIYDACYEGDDDGDTSARAHWTIDAKKVNPDKTISADADQGTYFVRNITPLQEPGLMGQDDKGRRFAAFNLTVRFEA